MNIDLTPMVRAEKTAGHRNGPTVGVPYAPFRGHVLNRDRNWHEAIHPDDREHCICRMLRDRRHRRQVSHDRPPGRHNGSCRSHILEAVPGRDQAGAIVLSPIAILARHVRRAIDDH